MKIDVPSDFPYLKTINVTVKVVLVPRSFFFLPLLLKPRRRRDHPNKEKDFNYV